MGKEIYVVMAENQSYDSTVTEAVKAFTSLEAARNYALKLTDEEQKEQQRYEDIIANYDLDAIKDKVYELAMRDDEKPSQDMDYPEKGDYLYDTLRDEFFEDEREGTILKYLYQDGYSATEAQDIYFAIQHDIDEMYFTDYNYYVQPTPITVEE